LRTRIRTVDLDSYSYSVARAYMIRLEKTDFESPDTLAALATEAKMTPPSSASGTNMWSLTLAASFPNAACVQS
jgi:hypothetical protein